MSLQYQLWFDLMQLQGPAPVTENLATFEPSPNITLPLFRFQKEWLRWGLDHEASNVRGGILADKMGLGKTIQAISMVITARDLHAKSEACSSSLKGNNRCTLVICPKASLNQWKKEIEKHTVKGSVSILVVHGENRPTGEVNFSQYDFVFTAYSTVESDYRKYIMLLKEVCKCCSSKFFIINNPNNHRRYR